MRLKGREKRMLEFGSAVFGEEETGASEEERPGRRLPGRGVAERHVRVGTRRNPPREAKAAARKELTRRTLRRRSASRRRPGSGPTSGRSRQQQTRCMPWTFAMSMDEVRDLGRSHVQQVQRGAR